MLIRTNKLISESGVDIQRGTGDVGSSKQNGVTSKYFNMVVDKSKAAFFLSGRESEHLLTSL